MEEKTRLKEWIIAAEILLVYSMHQSEKQMSTSPHSHTPKLLKYLILSPVDFDEFSLDRNWISISGYLSLECYLCE